MIIVEIFKILGFLIGGIFFLAAIIGLCTVVYVICVLFFDVVFVEKNEDDHRDLP